MNEALSSQFQIMNDLIKALATEDQMNAFLAQNQSCWPTCKNTLRDSPARPVPRQRRQGNVANCWAIATFRQWYSASVLKGATPSGLTVEKLTMGISFMYKSKKHGLRQSGWDAVILYMKRRGFVKDMRLHYKPAGRDGEETYEKFLCSRSLPLAVCLDVFKSYSAEDPRFRILAPTTVERARSAFEFNHTMHCALLMGWGIDEQGNEYWELFESRGRNWGDCGFVRLARHQGLIHAAVEMEL